MPARSSCGVVCIAIAAACSAGHTDVDPGDLELRDLLGMAPEVAGGWSASQRAAARRVLQPGLRSADAPSRRRLAADPPDLVTRVAQLLAAGDAARAADGTDPLGVVQIALDGAEAAIVVPRLAPRTAAQLIDDATRAAHAVSIEPAPPDDRRGAPELLLAEPWHTSAVANRLHGRGAALLAALADDANHGGGPLVVVPAPRLAVIAAYVRSGDAAGSSRLAINPVLLAALEPAGEPGATTGVMRGTTPPGTTRSTSAAPVVRGTAPPGTTRSTSAAPAVRGDPPTSAAGNPYSFYGSVAECAAAQRSRCDACAMTSTCQPITNIADGNAECAMLGASDGRGYFLLCINLALAITSIDRCTADAAPGCVRDPRAADTLATLDNNAVFLADPTCGDALDGCLARIFGPPHGSFPGPDAGTTVGEPPRSTSVSCSHSCDQTQNTSCSASPSCDCSGPSCNNSLTCDSACSSSNDQHGCGGNCDACTSDGGDDTTGDGCGGGSSSSSSGDGCSSGCGGSGGSCSGGGCSSGSGSGGSCSGGGCSSSSGSSSSGCGARGNGTCSAAAIEPAPGLGAAISALWASLPVALCVLAGQRARRRRSAGDRPRARPGAPRVDAADTTGDDAR